LKALRLSSYVLALGLVLSTATQLRFLPSFGVGELLLLVWCIFISLKVLLKNRSINVSQSKYFIFYWYCSFLFLFIGWEISLILGYRITEGARDFIAYLFNSVLFFLFFVSSDLAQRFKFLSEGYYMISVVYLIVVFSILQIDSTFAFKFLLFGGNRLSGFSDNPNQFALLLLPLPYLSIYYLKSASKYSLKAFHLLSLFLAVTAGFRTQSDALIVAWGASVALLILGFYIYRFLKRRTMVQYAAILFLLLFMVLLLFINADWIMEQKNEYMEEIIFSNSQTGIRFNLWLNGLQAMSASPIFGLGPGAFSGVTGAFQQTEAHNTFIDWGTNTGMLGITLMLFFLIAIGYKLIKKKKYLLIAMLCAILVFSMFHFTLRQPMFWFCIVMIILLMESNETWKYGNYSRKP
jgi:Lipid A core - O-antigen ligase and related enzymes